MSNDMRSKLEGRWEKRHPYLPLQPLSTRSPAPPRQRKRERRTGLTVGTVVLVVLLTLGAVHLVSNVLSRNDPPVSCQILGGSWSLWDGWQCG